MDDRKRQINEAEQRKKEQTILLDALLAHIGEAIFERTNDSFQDDASAFGEVAAYRRLQDDIASSQDAIQSAEEQMRRFKELESGIEEKEREESACSKELGGVQAMLGKLLLDKAGKYDEDNKAYEEFCAPHQGQADELLAKVQSLEERLAGLEQKEKGNVFTWIGKSAQSLVIRSFLGKAQENLEQIRRTVGEQFSGQSSRSMFPEASAVDALCSDIEQKRDELDAILRDLASLREEKRRISDIFSAEGGPIRHIQSLKNHIAHAQNELKALYQGVGAEVAFGESAPAERGQVFQSLARSEDQDNLNSAVRISQAIRDCDVVIGKLRASLAIDEEKAKIEKFRRMVQEKRDRILQAEKNILELEVSIRDSETNIEKLRRLL